MKFIYNDGGRAEAGFKGKTGDCAVRAISIATNIPYSKVYNKVTVMLKEFTLTKASKKYGLMGSSTSVRNGVPREVIDMFFTSIGWKWVPTMFFGKGCQVHLTESELPKDNLVVNLSKHVAAVVDGVLNDTHDCSRDGTRCVYGYWVKG